jgi:hypothetical protein
MCGHGWPLPPPWECDPWGAEDFGVGVDGVVVVVEDVEGVLGIDWVVVDVELGAAAAPAIPATAPPAASAPTTIPTRIISAFFIEPPVVGEGVITTIVGVLPKSGRTWA